MLWGRQMLSVQYGPFHPILEEALVEKLQSLKAADPFCRVVVVAPSRRLCDRLQRLLAVEKGLAVFNVHFHTFYSLAFQIIREGDPRPVTLLSDRLFHDFLVDHLLEEDFRPPGSHRPGPKGVWSRHSPTVVGSRRPKGFLPALRASLKDLVDSGVEPERVRELLAETEESGRPLVRLDPEEARRLLELLDLQERYQKHLEELGVTVPSGMIRLATELAPGSAYLKEFQEILYYGFYDLTGIQTDFFEAVSRHHPATLFFPYRHGHPAFAFARRFFEEKLHAAGRVPIALQPDEGRPPAPAPSAGLRVPAGRPKASSVPVRVWNAAGPREESWTVAKEILKLVRGGCAFHQIGIVARTLEPYRMVLRQVLEENRIPACFSSGRPLLSHPLPRFCFSLLSFKQRAFPAILFEDLLSSPYLCTQSWGDPERQKLLRRGFKRLAQRLRIQRGWLQWEGKVRSFLEGGLSLEGEEPEREGRLLWEWIREVRRNLIWALQEPAPWKVRIQRAQQVLERYFRLPADATDLEKRLWDGTCATLQELEPLELLGIGAEEEVFLEAWEDKLKAAEFQEFPGENLGVRVLDAMSARGESFAYLFLIGLQEGLFPRKVREDPLLRDSVRRVLSSPGGYGIRPKLEGYEEERLLFHLLTSSARKGLFCIYSRSDEEGRAKIASVYLQELARTRDICLEDSKKNRSILKQPLAKIRGEPWEVLSPKEVSLRLAFSGQSPGGFLESLGKEAELFRGPAEALEAMNTYGNPGEFDGRIGPPRPFLKALRRSGLSPSALASLARCPFQFFASRVLKLGEVEEPQEPGTLSSKDTGKIYHRVLELFYRKLLEQGYWKGKRSGFPRQVFEECEQQVFRQYHWKSLGLYPVLWEVLRERMLAHLREFLLGDIQRVRESGHLPVYFEQEFSASSSQTLLGKGRELLLHGFPDRVDLDEVRRRFWVFDYKTRGKKGNLLAEVLRGNQLQPLLYLEILLAALKREKGPGWEPQGTAFLILEQDPNGSEAKTIQEIPWPEFRAWRTRAARHLEIFLGLLFRGEFWIYPKEGAGGHCQWCAFSRSCRKGHWATRLRARCGAGFQGFHAVKNFSFKKVLS
ncbi:MAG: PD-(D/E)XK nuclease family protein [Elusimicrobia bacterium]|nr:PD-(D/E)XK nuclease family protein [Elusimicrobiota bacterium]